MEDVDCASILIDVDSTILEISSASMFITIITALGSLIGEARGSALGV